MHQCQDFKTNDMWVQSFRLEGVKTYTYSGQRWQALLGRCNSERDNYNGCTNEFLSFENFVEWHRDQVGYGLGYHVDKDVLIPGNKIYSPETCLLLPPRINKAVVPRRRKDDLPKGVRVNCSKYGAYAAKDGKFVHLGQFENVEDAFTAHKFYTESWIKNLADEYKDSISNLAYQALMKYTVEPY